MPRSNELTDITMALFHETPKAILVSKSGDEKDAIWLPKSQVEFELKKGNMVEVTMPVWLAEAKELV